MMRRAEPDRRRAMDDGRMAGWTEAPADDVGDALVAGFAASGVDHLFFTSGSEIGFFQEATAKARARGQNNPIRLITVPHEHASLNAALGFAAVSGPAGGDRGPCRLRHDALRRRRPYRGAKPPPRGDHRRLPADFIRRDAQGRARRGRPSLDAGDLRPERDRPELRQVGPPSDLAGQSRHHREPRGAGDAERALRPGLSELPQGAHPAPGRRRQLPERRPARHPRAPPRRRARTRTRSRAG